MGKVMSVFCNGATASVYNIKEVNSSFATASLDIMYTGKNRNKSDISRCSIERAIPTIYNVPIVCNWNPEDREIGGHDMEIVKDSDGIMHVRNMTVPCGVITDHTKFSFQVKEDENGVEHEYFVADGVVLWKRQDVYEYIVKDLGGVVPHSMEIDVKSGEKNDETGYYEVEDFEFTALCLLGNATPCFEGSQLKLYSASSLKDDISKMMHELKECYSLITSADDAAVNTNISTEGGDMMTEEKMKLIQEFGIDVESLDFSVEDLSVDELRTKFEEMKNAETETATEDAQAENTNETTDTDTADETANAASFELNSNIERQIIDAVKAEVVHYDWGDMPKYFFLDYDADASEVYAEATEDWTLYGFKYTMNGDNVVIDWESKTKKKYAIVNFDEGDAPRPNTSSAVFSAITPVIESAIQSRDEATEKFNEISEKYSAAEEELESLRAYKAQIEDAGRTEAAEAVFAQFSDIAETEAFVALRNEVSENNSKYSAEALEEKCYAIRGRLGTRANFALENKSTKIMLDKQDSAGDTPYGGVVEKYAGE